ncbi:MAG: TdeIII family type II restriction endonuclease [Luteimonas sp.]|nr:TdeIII family type II restriction endonuclease [Luteimonas sp.]
MNDDVRRRIADEFRRCIDNTLVRIRREDTHRPFHSALLSDEALFWSRFERSFSTSFGQSVIERVSRIVVEASGAEQASNQKHTSVSLTMLQHAAIDAHIARLRGGRAGRAPSWLHDLDDVMAESTEGTDASSESRVISDLWWRRDGVNHYLSIKTVKPNIDQTAEAKRDLLKLQLHDPAAKVYFGLYYNPYGEHRADYAWTPPMGVFDMRNDPVVLIGRDYWDTLGGSGTYDTVLAIATEVGIETRARIRALER